MNTETHKLKNDIVHTQGIGKEWLAAPNRINLGLFLLLAILHVESTAAADIQETRMGEALMQMEQGATAAVARATSEGWRTCDVKRVGPGWGNVYLRLVCNGGLRAMVHSKKRPTEGYAGCWSHGNKPQQKSFGLSRTCAVVRCPRSSGMLCSAVKGYFPI